MRGRWRAVPVVAAVALSVTGCTVVAGAFAHHNSRGRSCQSWYLPPAIDAFIGGAWAVGLAVAEEDAGWGWAGPGLFLGTAVIGTIMVQRCRGASHARRTERQRQRLRYSDDASIGTPQPIRGQPPAPATHRELPDSPLPPPPASEGGQGPAPGKLRLRDDYVVKDPAAIAKERLDKARRGELECGPDQKRGFECPDGFTCQQ
ncbi:MAG: hypothetical protein KJO07_18755, partial [Deltaproteobacteria bacterium]|nr:hypothetical protein [Deltaproteobacteria bacterium]